MIETDLKTVDEDRAAPEHSHDAWVERGLLCALLGLTLIGAGLLMQAIGLCAGTDAHANAEICSDVGNPTAAPAI